MKRIFTVFAAVLLVANIFAQSPEKMSYQAVIRNSSDQLILNTSVGMQVSILQGEDTGTATAVYIERQFPTTNANGLVSIEIGAGTLVSGNFGIIDWANGPYFIEIETDPAGGINYTITGTSQLLSVSYALYAKTAESFTGTIVEIDPIFDSSVSSGISASDTTNWNNKLDNYSETQTLADVASINNSVNSQIRNVTDPTDAQDAATKAYVDLLKERIEILEGTKIKDNRDGNVYQTVTIGTQVWMAENLAYLPSLSLASVESNTEPYYYVYNYQETSINEAKVTSYYDTYGVLYNWPAALNACPAGWHLPTDTEWATLVDFLGWASEVGGKLKETGTSHWESPNTGATNIVGFTALPGGFRFTDGIFGYIGQFGEFWSATEFSEEDAYERYIGHDNSSLGRDKYQKELGFSVRCVRD